jgi:hypothetical protein
VSTVWFALLALLALTIIAALVVVALRRRATRPGKGLDTFPGPIGPGGPLPVILVHGLFGFDRIGVPGVKLHYFRGIIKHLESLGCHAHAVRPHQNVHRRTNQIPLPPEQMASAAAIALSL